MIYLIGLKLDLIFDIPEVARTELCILPLNEAPITGYLCTRDGFIGLSENYQCDGYILVIETLSQYLTEEDGGGIVVMEERRPKPVTFYPVRNKSLNF